MDGMTPPPALFGVTPHAPAGGLPARGEHLAGQQNNATALSQPGEAQTVHDLAAYGALMGAPGFLPDAERPAALAQVGNFLARAQMEHFVGLEEGRTLEDVVALVQRVYAGEAMRILQGDSPSVEAACAAIRGAYAKRKHSKMAILQILTQGQQASGQTRGPIQEKASAIKAGLVISLVEVLSTEAGAAAYGLWGELVPIAVSALRGALQGVLGRSAVLDAR